MISTCVRDRMPDLVRERWLLMSIFRHLPGSGGAETELAEVTAVRCYLSRIHPPDFVQAHAHLLLDLLLCDTKDLSRP